MLRLELVWFAAMLLAATGCGIVAPLEPLNAEVTGAGGAAGQAGGAAGQAGGAAGQAGGGAPTFTDMLSVEWSDQVPGRYVAVANAVAVNEEGLVFVLGRGDAMPFAGKTAAGPEAV